MNQEQTIAFIRERLEEGSNRQYGSEPVSELEHALQCAALAQKDGAADELVVAALLHDFGRMVVEDEELPDSVEDHATADAGAVQEMGHDELGAQRLAGWFSDRILFCVGKHAQSKRYLCTTEPAYRKGLTEGSLTTLKKQGGLMSEEELAVFESSPYLEDAVRVRRWDDTGKVPGMETGTLTDYLELARTQLL